MPSMYKFFQLSFSEHQEKSRRYKSMQILSSFSKLQLLKHLKEVVSDDFSFCLSNFLNILTEVFM